MRRQGDGSLAVPDASRRADARPLLQVEALDAWYGPAQVLHKVSLSIAAGEAVVLLGRNGAGKSTTMKAIMGLEVERRGSIRFGGIDLTREPTHRIAQLGLGYVPEDRRIFAGLTVRENLAVGRQPPRDGADAWTPGELFKLFPNLASMQDRPGAQMSGGEQQMLTIARTLMGNPRCILLDEPSEGLAPVILEGIALALQELKRRGIGLLLSEQNLAFARQFADRVVILASGEVTFAGSIAAMGANPQLDGELLAI